MRENLVLVAAFVGSAAFAQDQVAEWWRLLALVCVISHK